VCVCVCVFVCVRETAGKKTSITAPERRWMKHTTAFPAKNPADPCAPSVALHSLEPHINVTLHYAAERRGNSLKGLQVFRLQVKARIWP